MSTDRTASRTIYNPQFVIQVLLVLLLISGLYSVALLRDSTQNIASDEAARVSLGEQNHEILQRLRDCTTPGHDCYDAGNKRTSVAIGVITATTTAASVASVYCALHLPDGTPPGVRACVLHQIRLAKRDAARLAGEQ